jgi:stearoyl-CoA desaturase (delta-9 desaturase)
LDRFGDSMITRIAFMAIYTTVYILFAPYWWLFLLLPIHFLMGPIQGAIVNWCGHKYGYSNYDNGDHSKNTTPFGILLMGELFQNNHHKYMHSANFAQRWFEVDITYPVMNLMHYAGIIRLKHIPVIISQEEQVGGQKRA